MVAQAHMREAAREAQQHWVEHILGTALAMLRALRRRLVLAHAGKAIASELPSRHRRDIDIVLPVVARIGRRLDPIDDAPAAAELHRAHADEVHLRLIDRAVALLDQEAGDAAPAELAGEREPDGAGADDEHGSLQNHGSQPIVRITALS